MDDSDSGTDLEDTDETVSSDETTDGDDFDVTKWNHFNFSPSREGQETVFGAQRPGYTSKRVSSEIVTEWCQFMHGKGITAVVCLLPPGQLGWYPDGLLAQYRRYFGEQNVLHLPCQDFRPLPYDCVVRMIKFLRVKVAASQKAVVHCSAGMGRTGLALTCWNAIECGTSFNEGAAACMRNSWGTTRNPTEYRRGTGPKPAKYLREVRRALRDSE